MQSPTVKPKDSALARVLIPLSYAILYPFVLNMVLSQGGSASLGVRILLGATVLAGLALTAAWLPGIRNMGTASYNMTIGGGLVLVLMLAAPISAVWARSIRADPMTVALLSTLAVGMDILSIFLTFFYVILRLARSASRRAENPAANPAAKTNR